MSLIRLTFQKYPSKIFVSKYFSYICSPNMVRVVQLVEHRIVVPSVVGSSPISHPMLKKETDLQKSVSFLFMQSAVLPCVAKRLSANEPKAFLQLFENLLFGTAVSAGQTAFGDNLDDIPGSYVIPYSLIPWGSDADGHAVCAVWEKSADVEAYESCHVGKG